MCLFCASLFDSWDPTLWSMARCGPRRHGSEPSAMEWQREPGHATESRHFATYCDMKIHENTWSTDEAQMKHMADRKPTIAWPSGPILKRHLHRRISFAKTTLFKQLLVLQETMLAPSKFCMPGWDWKGFFCVCLEKAPKQKLFYTFLASYMGLPRISRCQGDFRHISRRQLNGIVWRHLSGSGNEFVTVNFDCDGQGIWPDRELHVCHFETLPKEAFGSMMVQWWFNEIQLPKMTENVSLTIAAPCHTVAARCEVAARLLPWRVRRWWPVAGQVRRRSKTVQSEGLLCGTCLTHYWHI